jgi:hypothetical protein
MGTRPRTNHVLKLKSRRCPKCGGKINSQQTRCKRCHESQQRPKKEWIAAGEATVSAAKSFTVRTFDTFVICCLLFACLLTGSSERPGTLLAVVGVAQS